MSFSMTLRSATVVAALAATGAAQAGNTTIVTSALVANSVQAFSAEAAKGFRLTETVVSPLGNATTVSGTATPTFNLPITSITIDSKLNIVSGDAKGSALKFTRVLDDGSDTWVILANFTIDYANKKVLADATIPDTPTVKQQPIYNFTVNTPLSVKYKFPLSIVGHEVLDNLMLTEEAKDSFMNGLLLADFIRQTVLDTTAFGTLTQDVSVKFRPKAVSTRLYTVTQPAAQ
ncbi:MAG: hypothetical protein RI907_1059 [Pseudomonadota bacterium]|jgi:hypothetical protein